MTDTFRALCAELLKALESWSPGGGGPLEDADEIAEADLMARARALLDQPEPEGLTDEEIYQWWENNPQFGFCTEPIKLIRAALSRWGHPTPQPPADGEVAELLVDLGQALEGVTAMGWDHDAQVITRAAELLQRQHPQPVAVSERLPGPEDCDAEGRCWLLTVEDEYPQWRLHSIEGAQPGGAMIWVPVDSSPGVMVDCFYTSHWLPFHALPVPTSEGGC